MSSLDDFLSKREHDRRQQSLGAEAALAKAQLVAGRGSGMWEALKQTTNKTAASVGSVDGKPFEWDPYPFLKLGVCSCTLHTGYPCWR